MTVLCYIQMESQILSLNGDILLLKKQYLELRSMPFLCLIFEQCTYVNNAF